VNLRAVNAFYEVRPFPGYAPGEDATALLDRCRASPFLAALDRAVPPGARVLEVGCGTGQLCNFLALSGPRRRVLGLDYTRASLTAAEEFRRHAGVRNLQLARADLFAMPARVWGFDVVVCRGVVHHTPDPDGAIREVCARVRPGGHLVLGFYERIARLPHRLRRALSRGGQRPIRALDAVLRRRDLDEDKKRTWIEDQYRHPLEHSLSFLHVLDVVRSAGLTWVASVPPAPPGGLFDPTPVPSRGEMRRRRFEWAWRCLMDEDAGLVCLVARRER
jgi:SAM-dependent methyltransferase